MIERRNSSSSRSVFGDDGDNVDGDGDGGDPRDGGGAACGSFRWRCKSSLVFGLSVIVL